MTAVDLHRKHSDLLQYFTKKLEPKVAIKDKDRQDMTVFSIMLLISRLLPYSFASIQDVR